MTALFYLWVILSILSSSPILIGYSLYSIFLLPIHSPPILASNMSPVVFFYSFASLCFLLFSLHLTMWHQAACQLSTYLYYERMHKRTWTNIRADTQTHYLRLKTKEMNHWLAMHVGIGKRKLPARAWNMDCGHICVLDRVESHRPWLQSLPMMLDSSHCNYHIARVQFRNQGSFTSRSISQISSTKKSSKYLTDILAAIRNAIPVLAY